MSPKISNALKAVILILATIFFASCVIGCITRCMPSFFVASDVNGVAVMVTLLGIMVTILTILLALAALWGYGGLKTAARRVAIKESEDVLKKHVEKYQEELAERLSHYPQADEIIALVKDAQEQTANVQGLYEDMLHKSGQLSDLLSTMQSFISGLNEDQAEGQDCTPGKEECAPSQLDGASNGIKGQVQPVVEAKAARRKDDSGTYPTGNNGSSERTEE